MAGTLKPPGISTEEVAYTNLTGVGSSGTKVEGLRDGSNYPGVNTCFLMMNVGDYIRFTTSCSVYIWFSPADSQYLNCKNTGFSIKVYDKIKVATISAAPSQDWWNISSKIPSGDIKITCTTAGQMYIGEMFIEYAEGGYIDDPLNLVPRMTSDTSPAGYIASASSVGTAIMGAAVPAYMAFDKICYNGYGWWSNATTGWLAIELPVAKAVGKYNLYCALSEESRAPKNWTFEALNGSNWVVLDTRTNITGWVSDEPKTFTFINETAYKKYRINITANNGGMSCIVIGEMDLFEYVDPDVYLIRNGEFGDADIITLKSGSPVSLGKIQAQLTTLDFKNNGAPIALINVSKISQLSPKFSILVDTPFRKIYSKINVSQHFSKLVLAAGDVNLSSVECVSSVTLTSTTTGTSSIKAIVSVDSGTTWQTWNEATWINIEPIYEAVAAGGMNETTLNGITKESWASLIGVPSTIRFGYALTQMLSTETCNCDSISLNVDMMGKWRTQTANTGYYVDMASRENNKIEISLLSSGDYKINY